MAFSAGAALRGSLSANAAAVHGIVAKRDNSKAPSFARGRGKCNVNHPAGGALVKCDGSAGPDDTGSIASRGIRRPRRELLLAGSSVLLMPAGAALAGKESGPVPPPDYSKCQTGYATQTQNFPVECCPGTPVGAIVDFKPDPRVRGRVRKALHTLNKDEIRRLTLAYQRMRDLPATDTRSLAWQGEVHCQYCNGVFPLAAGPQGTNEQVHFNWLFFPFHRAYIYFHERILASLVGDDTFTLPYWNWDNQTSKDLANVIPEFFQIAGSGLYDQYRNPEHVPGGKWPIANLTYDGRQEYPDADTVRANNLAAVYNSVAKVLDPRQFLGIPIYADGTYDVETALTAGGGTLEMGPHNSVHTFGGIQVKFDAAGNQEDQIYKDLGNFATAGYDPLFYHHHSNVDRLWSVWHKLPADEDSLGRKVRKVKLASGRTRGDNYRKNHDDPEFLNAAFLFYDQNRQLTRIKVSDTLNHVASLGYDFTPAPEDAYWINFGKLLEKSGSSDPAVAQQGAVDLLKGIAKDPAAAFKGRRVPLPPVAAQLPRGLLEELGSRKSRNFEDVTTGDKPFTRRVVPDPVPKELQGLAFQELEKTLVLEDVLVPNQGSLAFTVFVNLPQADAQTSLAIAQYVGSFKSIPGGKVGGDTGKFRRVDVSFPLSANLELLGVKNANNLLVTIVPQSTDTVEGVKLKGISLTYS